MFVFLLLLFVLFWSFITYCLTFSITPVLHEINNVIVLLVTGTVTTESIPFNSCHILFLPQMGFFCCFCYFMHSFGTLALSLLFSMWFDLLKFDIDVVLQSELCRYVDTNTHTYSFTPEWNFKIERNLLFYSLKWMHNGTKMDAQWQRWADNLWWNKHGYGFPIHFQFTTISLSN